MSAQMVIKMERSHRFCYFLLSSGHLHVRKECNIELHIMKKVALPFLHLSFIISGVSVCSTRATLQRIVKDKST